MKANIRLVKQRLSADHETAPDLSDVSTTGQTRYPHRVTRNLRRAFALLMTTLWLGAASLALAGPASADVPEGWPTPDDVDPLHSILLLGAVPIGLFLLIAVLVYAPAMARGERVAPGAAPVENQWLGGPRKKAGELAAPDGDSSKAGGASGRW